MFATCVPPHLVIANSIVGLQRELNVLRVDVLTKLENLPEALKQCMLQNFYVDGATPITYMQVVDVLVDLKSSLETSFMSAIRLDRETYPAVQVIAAAVDVVAGHASTSGNHHRWSWKGRIHPVPQDF